MIHRRIFKYYITILSIILFIMPALAQPDFLHDEPTAKEPPILYYPYYEDEQMIEIDYAVQWIRTVDWKEGTQPRGTSWSSVIPAPPPNIFLFRNRAGKITKAFNTTESLDALTQKFGGTPDNRNVNTVFKQRKSHAGKFRREEYKLDPAFNGYYLIHSANTGQGLQSVKGKVGLIDSLGQIVSRFEFDKIYPAGDHFLVIKNKKYGISKLNHPYPVPCQYDEISQPDAQHILFRKNAVIEGMYDTRKAQFIPLNQYDWMDENLIQEHANERAAEPVRIQKEGKMGLVDRNFRVMVAPIYDYLDPRYRDGLLLANRNGKWGYLDIQGNEQIPCRFEDAIRFDNGEAYVLDEGRKKCINTKGEDIGSCKADYSQWKILYPNDPPYIKGRKIISRASLNGLLDQGDKLIVPIMYESILPVEGFEDPKIRWDQRFLIVQKLGKKGIMDKNGVLIIPCIYDEIRGFLGAGHFMLLEKNKVHGLLNTEMQELLPCRYKALNPFTFPGKVWFQQDSLWGLMNFDQTVLIPPKYQEVSWIKNGYIQVKRNKRYGMIDSLGQELIPTQYPSLGTEFHNGLLIAMNDRQWGFIDSLNQPVIPFMYDDVRRFQKSITGVKKGKYYGFINRNNLPVSEFMYDFIGHDWFPDGLVLVRKNNKIGFVNEEGRELIPCIYDDEGGYNQNGHRVKKGKEWVYVKGP